MLRKTAHYQGFKIVSAAHYPAVIHGADENGQWVVEVPCANVRGVASSLRTALTRATAELQDKVDTLASAGEVLPVPGYSGRKPQAGAISTFLSVLAPSDGEALMITIPHEILEEIDRRSEDREEFIIEALRQRLGPIRTPDGRR
ncbi:hypothetical protein [Vannielia litorea]|uniref:hypothetical protein n=1 Tax=Vannielia litorea TaxID=1217970 RepID=UPI001BCD9916|nr:hypothetical protein [Vannielia litorea]MBS8227140.1 hypothetical protein [Vannielia litorea]